jgi:hypothetical protein
VPLRRPRNPHSLLEPLWATRSRGWQSRLRPRPRLNRVNSRQRRHSGHRFPSNQRLHRKPSNQRSLSLLQIPSSIQPHNPRTRCLLSNRRHLCRLHRRLSLSQDRHFNNRPRARTSNTHCSNNQPRVLSSHTHPNLGVYSRVVGLWQGVLSLVG